MTESKFVSQNQKVWEGYKDMIDSVALYSPNELGQAYLCLCSDLAFAQSHFPDTQVCRYLNSLALQYQHVLYRRQPQRWHEFQHFFTHDVPLSFYQSRKYLLLALVLFILGTIAGVISQHLDTEYFVRFFGHDYYAETMANIKKGDPMGIYGNTDEVTMYFQIAFNNIKVGLMYFISGLLSPFFSIFSVVMNSVMMGCFEEFFAQQGCLSDALIAPNEHGALELPACIISSAAGIQLGMGWFFPGKLTRMQALRKTAMQSLTMALAAVPIFAVAAFIESFVTRHQEWSMFTRIALVFAGLMFILYYCVLLPRQLARKEGRGE